MQQKKNIVQTLKKTYLFMAVLPMLVLTILTAVFYVNSLIDSSKENLQTVLNLYTDKIDSTINQGIKVIDIVQNDLSVQNALRMSQFKEKKEYYVQRTTMNTTMMMINQNYGESLNGAYILLDDGRCFKSSNFPYNGMDYTDQEWYHEIRESKTITGSGYYGEPRVIAIPEKEGFISLGEPITNYRTGEVVGIVIVEIELETFSDLLSQTVTISDLNVSINEQDGTNVWQYVADEENSEYKELFSRYLNESIHRELSNGWRISMSTNWFNSIRSELCKTLTILLVVIVLVSFAAAYFGNRFADTINKPVNQLINGMNHNRNKWIGEALVIETSYCELDNLTDGVNELIEKVNQMIEEVKKTEREMRQVQFSALQAQINPHFLYNMLDHISWQIRIEQYEQAVKSLMSLSKFFRISLKMEEELVTLEKELEHAQIYMDLQIIRYGREISFEIVNHLDKYQIETLIVPKFILQPIIENAICHGLRDSGREGIISLKIYEENKCAVIEIFDSGIGIAKEELKKLNQALRCGIPLNKEVGGYGIVNVSQRISYRYGENYKLLIESTEGEYTLVKMCLPFVISQS